MANGTELEMVLGELATLRRQVESLERALMDARGRASLSMRDQVRCPHCGARTIAHFESIPDFGYGQVHKQGLVHVDRGIWREHETDGHTQAYVCTECGAMELWLADTSLFKDGEGPYTLLTSEDPGTGPFR